MEAESSQDPGARAEEITTARQPGVTRDSAPPTEQAPRPDVSICIVAYRCRESLVASLAQQRRRRQPSATTIETIVVDNGSGDGTVEAVREAFPDVRLEALDDNRGFAHAANRALKLGGGRYLLLLNPDVQVSGDALDEAVRFLDGNPRWGVLGIRLRYPDGRIQGTCGHFPDTLAVLARSLGIHGLLARLRWFSDREDLNYFCFPAGIHEVDGVLGAFLMMRQATFDRVGPLDEGYFLYGEDLDWCRRARGAGVGWSTTRTSRPPTPRERARRESRSPRSVTSTAPRSATTRITSARPCRPGHGPSPEPRSPFASLSR